MPGTLANPAPGRARIGFLVLLFGASAAPLFWLGQLMLGYWVTSRACYGVDHPTMIAPDSGLRLLLIVFDAVAFAAVAAGAAASWWSWQRAQNQANGSRERATRHGRTRFLAIWGLFSSLWFFGAVLFNTISSIAVPLCTR